MINPLVSIIVPAYHAGWCIQEAFEGFRNQTFKDFEVIVVIDDAHFDDTIFKIEKFKQDMKILPIVREFKTNPANARNLAISKASGKYIAFCDADDWWEPEKLERQIAFMESNDDVDLCYTQVTMHYPDGSIIVQNNSWGSFPLWLTCGIPHSTVLVKKFFAENIQFDITLKGADDYKWLLDLYYDNGVRIMDIGRNPEANIRIHANNLTNFNKANFKQLLKLHQKRKEYTLGLFKYVTGHLTLLKKSLISRPLTKTDYFSKFLIILKQQA